MRNLFSQFGVASAKKSAFTLIELLTAMTVFALFISVLASSYLLLTRASRETNLARKLYSEARFLTDEIIAGVRGGEIDYECFSDPTGDNSPCALSTIDPLNNTLNGTSLAVMRPDGTRVIFAGKACEESGCYTLEKVVQAFNKDTDLWEADASSGYRAGAGDDGFQILHLDNIEIEDMRFVIRPGSSDANASRVAPTVSLYFTLRSIGQLRDVTRFPVQTTINLRSF